MFILRNVHTDDLKGLLRLAKMLNTVNLPHDREALTALIERSVDSFKGDITDVKKREYLFVLEEVQTGKIIGTSMIIAQHGTREAPHVYFEVIEDQRYSSTLDRHFHHKVLRLGKNFDGPTEIGGLILDPAYRGTPERLGKQLSYVRFLFIAMHRRWFRKKLLAELLPPLLPDGKSLLWEHLGRLFTELDYAQADHISRTNKEFITSLFPAGEIYATLMPEAVQEVIGQVGQATQGVRKMLEGIGFEYSYKIDPFDGGPHFEADIQDVSLINQVKKYHLSLMDAVPKGEPSDTVDGLVAAYQPDARQIQFKAIFCPAQIVDRSHLAIDKTMAQACGWDKKQTVFFVPMG